MIWQGISLLAIFVVMALGLTWIAVANNLMLFRVAAALSWLSLGMALLLGMVGMPWAQPYTQVLGFVFIIMTAAPLTLQMVTEVERERNGMRWKEWTRYPNGKPKSRGRASSDSYRSRLRGVTRRYK